MATSTGKTHRVGLDLDGVFFNFIQHFNDLVWDMHKVKLEYPATTWEWWQGDLPKDQYASAWDHIRKYSWWWRDCPPLPNAREYATWVNNLTFDGHQVYFITSRQGELAKKASADALRAVGVHLPTVLIAQKPEDKILLAEGLRLTHFVDDKVETVAAVLAYLPGCVSKLYTTSVNYQATLPQINYLTDIIPGYDNNPPEEEW